MLSRLEARLRRLEQQRQEPDTALAQGLSGLLAYARAHHSEAVPIADLTDAELDAKITALAGTRALTPAQAGPGRGAHTAPGSTGQGAPSMSRARPTG